MYTLNFFICDILINYLFYSVTFPALNFERSSVMLRHYIKSIESCHPTTLITRTKLPWQKTDILESIPVSNTIYPEVQLNASQYILTPSKTAIMESIFEPTKFGDKLFKTWSNLKSDKLLLSKCINLFQKESMFLVSIHVREAESWMDAWLTLTGFKSGGLLRNVSGRPIILSPEVCLFFHFLMIVINEIIIIYLFIFIYLKNLDYITSKCNT